MSTIKEKLNTVLDCKHAIKAAIEEKGGSVTDFSSFADAVRNIKGGVETGNVKITYNLGGTEETNHIGTGELYMLINNIYLDGELYDIDDLIVVGLVGSGSGSGSGFGSGSGAGVGCIAFPEGISGQHVVEFDLGTSMFEEVRHIKNGGVENYTIDKIPEANSVTYHANGVEFVDLGLPSGKLWAKCNVGSNSENGDGKYFQWGDTKGYTSNTNDGKVFSWKDYKYGTEYNQLTKYVGDKNDYGRNADNLKELELEDDMARVNLGGSWVTPTKKDFQELIDHTDKEWTAIGGVKGYKFTSKVDNSKYIFIPAAGCRSVSNLDNVGNVGYMWSRSVRGVYLDKAFYLYFLSLTVAEHYNVRCLGFSVRGLL